MIARVRLLLWGLAVLLALWLVPGRALAHAHLVQADLAPDGHLLVPAGTYHFWFDEGLNSALSRIIIKNAQGQQVNPDTGTLNPANSEEMDVTLPALPPGQYSVFWTSDSSQDGHILHGFYLFTAGGAGAKTISSSPAVFASVSQPDLDPSSLAAALAHWLVLLASTIWTGALAFELLVLAPARKVDRARFRTIADGTSIFIGKVVVLGLLATVVTSVVELETQAYAAGGWAGTTSGSVLNDILVSHYGQFWIIRVACALVALGVAALITAKGSDSGRSGRRPALQFLAGSRSVQFWLLGALGLGYLLALAYSGHAAAVSQLIATSVLLDWLHLLANTVWVGGMAAIALALVPALHGQARQDARSSSAARAEFLLVLDRFSPAAFLALATAAITGMFNAQVHLSSFGELTGTAYGRFLLIKLALIAEIIILSASHVFVGRPRLRRLGGGQLLSPQAESIFASLIPRLRVEPLLGALILLCVALMGQVAPAVSVFTTPVAGTSTNPTAAPTAAPTQSTPASIQGEVKKGLLDVSLTITPPNVGKATFFATVRERGAAVTDGQVRVRLSMPANASLGNVFVETTLTGGGYRGAGDLVLTGHWRADVLVRTHSDPLEFRDLPFDFVAGPGATFLTAAPINTAYGPATVTLTQPTAAPASLSVHLRPGLQVRFEVEMLGMPGMGSNDYPAAPIAKGAYQGTIVFPMAGVTRVTIQVRASGIWQVVRVLVYDVDGAGTAHLLTGGAAPAPTPAASTARTTAYNVPFALHLPYTAFITRMGNNTVTRLDGSSVHTGQMPHGVDVVDGTNLAYVTDFLSGDVVILDTRTLRVLHRIPVGLEPAHVVFTHGHTRAFVTNFLTNDVSVIDMRTAKVVGDIPVGLRPHGLDMSPDGHTIYVACEGAGSIYVIDTRSLKVIGQAPAGLEPIGVTVNPVNGEINITDARGNAVYILRPGSLTPRAVVPVGNGPALSVISDDGSRLYVANQLGNTVSVIDVRRARVIATIPVGSAPHGPDITPDDKYVYVPSINAGTITIIRTADNTVAAVVPIGKGPNEVSIAR
ncbi:MAG TPA: CopD family protein [Chloroflexota bacterium]|nr:CopD family protein [Chloroflexota bacterium]